MKNWVTAASAIGIVVLIGLIIWFLVKKKDEAPEVPGMPPPSDDAPGIDDIVEDIVEGALGGIIDIAWDTFEGVVSPVIKPPVEFFYDLLHRNQEEHEFIRSWRGESSTFNFGPAAKKMYYTAAWRTDPKLIEGMKEVPGVLAELEENRRWLESRHLVPERPVIYIPPTPEEDGEPLVFVSAWVVNPFVKAGTEAMATLVWRNSSQETVYTEVFLKIKAEHGWYEGPHISSIAIPGETKAVGVTRMVRSSWQVDQRIDAEIWWRFREGSWIFDIGRHHEKVWELKDAYLVVESLPGIIPPFL